MRFAETIEAHAAEKNIPRTSLRKSCAEPLLDGGSCADSAFTGRLVRSLSLSKYATIPLDSDANFSD